MGTSAAAGATTSKVSAMARMVPNPQLGLAGRNAANGLLKLVRSEKRKSSSGPKTDWTHLAQDLVRGEVTDVSSALARQASGPRPATQVLQVLQV